MSVLRSNKFALSAIAVVGFASHYYTMKDLDERTAQQLTTLKIEQQNGGKETKGTESTKIALQKMLTDLPNKSTRQKLEDAVDAAHRTHGIGFRNSPLDPIDVGMPTSYKSFEISSEETFKPDSD